MEGERRQKPRNFRGSLCRQQQERGPLCATTALTGPTSSHGVLPRSRRVWLPVAGEYVPTTTTATTATRLRRKCVQPSKVHKLQQLGLYTNTDTSDTAHQLPAEVVATEVAYTMNNTQPSCLGRENRTVSRTPSRRPWASPRRRVGRPYRTKRLRAWKSTVSSNWYQFPQIKRGPSSTARKTTRRPRCSATVCKAAIPRRHPGL